MLTGSAEAIQVLTDLGIIGYMLTAATFTLAGVLWVRFRRG